MFDLKKPLITIASGNPKKVAEIEAMLGPLPIEIKKQPSSLDVEETGKTYLDNALLKAKAAAELTKSWTIADDSGLEIDSLGNAPGIFSARLAETNEKKIEKILTAPNLRIFYHTVWLKPQYNKYIKFFQVSMIMMKSIFLIQTF